MRVGFRTVEIDAIPDGEGIPFAVRVNDTPVFVRGANWIPDDTFPSRVDRSRYARRIADAIDANVNLVRVWGGGIYEANDFDDLCDERGVLVWQDFLFACAAYPEEESLWSEVAAEARDAVNRLASHPSLALWNGANENIWGHADWGWIDELGDRTWGEAYYLQMLPSIVGELDPDRPYIPNSPFSWDPSHHPNDPSDGLVHIWESGTSATTRPTPRTGPGSSRSSVSGAASLVHPHPSHTGSPDAARRTGTVCASEGHERTGQAAARLRASLPAAG